MTCRLDAPPAFIKFAGKSESSRRLHSAPAGRYTSLRATAKPSVTATVHEPVLESTVRYLGIEVDDALEISEQTEI